MPVETVTYVNDLVVTNPAGTDERRFGDDHLRLIKTALKNTFPNATAPFGFPITESRSSDTPLAVIDRGKLILASGTYTQTFATAATLGSGWSVNIRNVGTGIITLDPAGAETIGGAATFPVFPDENLSIICTGTAFLISGASERVLLVSKSGAASGHLFTGIGANLPRFRTFEFTFERVVPVASGQTLYAKCSSDNGSSFASSTSHVRHGGSVGFSSASVAGNNGDTIGAALAADPGTTAVGVEGFARMHPGGSFHWSLSFVSTAGNAAIVHGATFFFSTTNAVQFLWTGTNFASGTIRCYGMV